MFISFFWIILSCFFLLEGVGFEPQQKYGALVYAVVPVIFFLFIKKKDLALPKKITILFVVFLISLFISSLFFSVDKETSIIKLVFYTSSFLFFLIAYNFNADGQKYLIFLYAASGVFIVYSIMTNYFTFLIPWSENQFVFPFVNFHNHLGDFLGLGIFASIYLFAKSKKFLYVFILLGILPFFILSNSRSAFLAEIVCLGLFFIIEQKKKPVLVLFFCVVCFSILQIVSIRSSYFNKNYFGSRPSYAVQSIKAALDRPFYGYGLENYTYLSKKYAQNYTERTTNAHNIFFDFLSEGGIVPFMAFLSFVILVVRHGFKTKSILFYGFFYLLLNFQTDYTYKIPGLFILFILFAGFSHHEDNWRIDESIAHVLSLLILIPIFLIFSSTILLSVGQSKAAYIFFPYSKQAHKDLIEKEVTKKNFKNASVLMSHLEWLAPNNITDNLFLANKYEQLGNKRKALQLLLVSYNDDRFVNLDVVKEIYTLTKETKSALEAKLFMEKVMEDYRLVPNYVMSQEFKNELNNLCYASGAIQCLMK